MNAIGPKKALKIEKCTARRKLPGPFVALFEDARLHPSTGCRLVFKQTGSLLTGIEIPYEKYVSQYLGA
jgi:hypothetical protein